MRQDAHPLIFAATEAITSHASVALIVWETPSGYAWRTFPHASQAVLIGLHDVLGVMIDRMREGDEAEAEDAAG